MNHIHTKLRERYPWYDRWHSDKQSSAVALSVFFLFAILTTSTLVNAINDSVQIPEGGEFVSLVSGSFPGSATAAVARLKQVSDSVLTKANEHALSAPGRTNEKLAALRTALQARYDALNELALTNPQEVRRFIFDSGAMESIPRAARDLVEKPFEKEGVFHVALVSEEFFDEGEESHEEYILEISPDEIYRLALTPEEAYALPAEKKIKVSGVEIADRTVVPTATFADTATDTEPEVLGASTIKKVAFIAVNFTNDTREPYTTDQLTQMYLTNSNSLAAHMREVSGGQWDIQGNVFGWYTIAADNSTSCDYSGWASKASAAATAAGVNLSAYTNIQYILVSAPSCGWSGLAYMPGTTSWIAWPGAIGVLAHELGHNYGFHHAGTAASEYGDGADPMGGAKLLHYSNYNKGRFWLPSTSYMTVNAAGVYTLNELKSSTQPGVVGIRVPRKDGTTNQFLLEYRTTGGFDSVLSTTYQNKVLIRVVPSTFTTAKTTLVAVLGAGQSYTSTVDGITFTAVSTGSTSASVNIDMVSAPCTRTNPTVTATPSGQWGSAGQTLNYTLTVKNNDSSSCGSSVFTSTPMLSTGFTQSPSAPTLTLDPGAQASVAFSVTAPATAVSGTYTVTQQVQNGSDTTKVGTASVNYNIAAPDATAPVVAITTPLNGAKISGSKVNVSATASDASGVGMIQIIIDGNTMKTCTGVTSCSYSWNTRKVSAGSHTIKAVATDASAQKNVSETSISVTK